jgi:NADPH-dependent curcumin reductase CurA
MAEYLFSDNVEDSFNYDILLLTDINTSTFCIAKYLFVLNYPDFDRYSGIQNVGELKESYLCLLLKGDTININYAAGEGHLEVVKYLYSKGL